MQIFRWGFLLLVMAMQGCASNPDYKTPANVDKEKLAKIHVYRTDVAYHSFNPEKPFFYINGQSIGKLGTGDALSIEVIEGDHVISVRDSILFMPAFEKLKLNMKVQAKKIYYIRYSKDFTGVTPVGSTIVTSDDSSLSIANEDLFNSRK